MPSERQIAANRENALRSSGPRSSAGKRRSSANALRHGLSRIANMRAGEDIEALAHLVVGPNADEETLEQARSVVRAQLDLIRIREIKRDLLERVYRVGMADAPPLFRSCAAQIRYVMHQPFDRPLRWPERFDRSGPMPSDKDERVAETMRRLLPELENLNRYERRAFKAKQRASSKLANLVRF
jgi:hypothetical protein